MWIIEAWKKNRGSMMVFLSNFYLILTTACILSTSLKAPVFIKEFSTLIYFRHKPPLDCPVDGDPLPKVQWLKNNERLEYEDYLSFPTRNTSIDPAFLNGIYRCIASNPLGTITSPNITAMHCYVKPANPKKITLNATPGLAFTMECSRIEAFPQQHSYKWKINGKPFNDTDRIFVDNNGNLQFHPIITEDFSKKYHCGYQNSECDAYQGLDTIYLKSVNETTHQTAIFSPVNTRRPLNDTQKIEVLKGDTVVLSCNFRGLPLPKIHWLNGSSLNELKTRKDSFFFDLVGRKKSLFYVPHETTTRLVLKNVLTTTPSYFVCIGFNRFGVDAHYLQLEIQLKPYFASESVSERSGYMLTNLTLHCAPEGLLEPHIEWFYNGLAVVGESSATSSYEFKVRSKGKKLHILKKIGFNEENKSFIIQCIASNQMGAASKSTSITVISTTEVVDGPSHIFYNGTTPNISINCEAVFDKHFPGNITWYKFNGSEWMPIKNTSSTDRNLEFSRSLLNQDQILNFEMNWLKDLDQNLLLNTWDTHSGQYKCIASNLYSSDERVAWLLPQPTKRTSAQILREVFRRPSLYMTSFVGVAIVVLISALIIILVNFLKCRSATYIVDEKERNNGKDPLDEIQHEGFRQYTRRYGGMSRISLFSTELSIGSEYNDDECKKYNEDGSFIGDYILD